MKTGIYTFELSVDLQIVNLLSNIDRFDAEWAGIERREGLQTLKELKSIATVNSVGASTRIEGSRMTNEEVYSLLFERLKMEKLEDRDQQEVAGYFTVLDTICESFRDIDISENAIKNLHNILMRFSEKDQWHKGNYKQHPNSVEAEDKLSGTKTTLFKTTPPGFETSDAMQALISWYNSDTSTPPIIKCALFVYDFLSIHPFQDGNGRLSRLLGTLLLLKNGYSWIQYISFEHEIENRKTEYYQVLMECQHNRPGEDVTSWLRFFLDCLGTIQANLRQKLEVHKGENQLSPRDKMIYAFIKNHPGSRSGEIAQKLHIPLPTVKKTLSDMVAGKFISKYGSGAGTNYTIEKLIRPQNDVLLKFTEETKNHEFTLINRYSYIAIKKIILRPRFEWQSPDDWASVLFDQNLELMLSFHTNKGEQRFRPLGIDQFDSGYNYRPIFSLNEPLHLPLSIWEKEPFDNEFPIRLKIELSCSEPLLKFDVSIVYDAALE